MSKKFYLVTVIVTLGIAAILVLFLFFFTGKNKQAGTSQNVSRTKENYELLPIEDLAKKPNLQIDTNKGSVAIDNVYKNPVEKLSRNGVEFKESEKYNMSFYPQNNGFLIVITDPNVVASEKEAENDFLSQLEISKDDACKLEISITVPFGVSEKYSGKVYGFSFCPNVDHIE